MENLVMENLFNRIYKNKTVLITGHTGFKGSWLTFWLNQMGANIVGYSLEPPTSPNHIQYLDFDIKSIIGDTRDGDALNKVFNEYKPDIVFHLAAQPLVKFSYENPLETYETNVIGTLKTFEACKKYDVKAIVNITSDKAYENQEFSRGYKENDPMGGHDPYSSSKGCADLLANSYRKSFFNILNYKKTHNTLLASCRAGNVIGGGDWAKDRLIPDIVLSVSEGKKVRIRNPKATRPWQHVLEPLSGYLLLGQRLLEEKKEYGDAWNFGPSNEASITVEEVVKNVETHWDKIDYEIVEDSNQFHEANLLKLDCSKANNDLNWTDVWSSQKTFEKTINWYKAFYEDKNLLTQSDLEVYVDDARAKGLVWT
tara:strand:+ start:253 stop:1359 length:1107 start_codon:yes stop_codon:yes gene_type:complete